MNDDWRLHVDVRDSGLARSLSERLDAVDLEHQLETAFHDRVIVSLDGSHLYCYTGSRAQAEAVERLVAGVATERGWDVECSLARWHPEAERWEAPDIPLPQTEAQREAEHAALIAREREETARQGYPSFEVRVQFVSERDCAEFAARLEGEGLPVLRRSKFLVVGAADQDSADALAARFHREAPDGSAVVAEGTRPAVLAGSPLNPFALFGGLGG